MRAQHQRQLRQQRYPELRRLLHLERVFRPELRGSDRRGLRSLRHSLAHLQQRYVVRLDDVHGSGDVRAEQHPSLWQRRQPNLRQRV